MNSHLLQSRSVLVVGGLWLLSVGLSCAPAAENAELVLGRRSRLRAVDGEGEAGVGRELHRVEGNTQLADNGMAEPLGAGVVQTDIVCCPTGAERIAAGGQFADQLGQLAVVRVAARFGA